MSRRCVLSKDPTSKAALGFEGIELIHSILDTLTEPEAMITAEFFGLSDGGPLACMKVCIQYGLDGAGATALLEGVLSKLRHPSRKSVLGVWENGILVDTVSTRLLPDLFERPILCLQCHKVPIDMRDDSESPKGGRQRKYCSNACRQEAYRARKKEPARNLA